MADQPRQSLCDLLGRYDWHYYVVNVGLNSDMIIGANSRRVYLLIHDMGGTGDIVAAPHRQPAPQQGIGVGTLGAGAIEFWFPRHGPLSTVEWWADSAGGLGTVYILEVLYK